MSRKEVERLYERCRTDPEFRAKVRSARRAHVEAEGFDLDEDEWAEFEKIDWDRSDEELLQRYGGPGRVT